MKVAAAQMDIDPAGDILAHGGDRETLLIGEISPHRVEQACSDMPFLKDRKKNCFRENGRTRTSGGKRNGDHLG